MVSYSNRYLPAGPIAPAAVSTHRHLQNGIELIAGRVAIRATAIRDDIIRVRMCIDENWYEDASWVVTKSACCAQVDVEPLETEQTIGFRTPLLQIILERETARLIVLDHADQVISEHMANWPVTFQNGGFSVFTTIAPKEHFFGLGDKTGSFSRNNQSFTLWNTDPQNFQESTDPIYKSIPFVLAMRKYASVGILLDNTSRSHFDFGKRLPNVFSFGAEAEPLNYYIIYGTGPKEVLSAYTFLTGPPPIPPLWALGYQQSRYSYKTADDVRAVTNRLRTERFPADAVYLDIDFQDRLRPFTYDPSAFSDFSKLIDDLAELNFRVVAITDPHLPMLPDQAYEPYISGAAGDHFVCAPDGSIFAGKMWAGVSAYPDFTKADSRSWWGTLYQDFVDAGVAGFWNDMNEPVVADGPDGTMPLDTKHKIREPGFVDRTADHREIHNIYGMQNSRATFEGLLTLRPRERPFVLTRSTFAGGHRYSATWTGDNSATWNHLRLAISMLLNLGLSGFALCGADVGGFFGSVSAELLTRWFQVGAFMPLFRNHAFKDSALREPWLDGESHSSIRRRFVEERYRLLPYIYSLVEESARTGLPIMRPMFLEFPSFVSILPWYVREPLSQFMLGPCLVIAPPPFGDMPDPYVVTLPPLLWYDYWTGLRVDVSGQNKVVTVRVIQSLETIPVYVRGGSILPRQPLTQSTAETPVGPLELLIYPGINCHGSIYVDDGKSYDFKNGDFLRQTVNCSTEENLARVRLAPRLGNYVAWWSDISIVLHDAKRPPCETYCSFGVVKNVSYDQDNRILYLEVPDTIKGGVVIIKFANTGT